MTQYDDPNREAVGLEPIWTSAGVDEPPPEVEPPAGAFDPSSHTVAEVEAFIAAHPDQEAVVLAAEAAGKNRTSLTGGFN